MKNNRTDVQDETIEEDIQHVLIIEHLDMDSRHMTNTETRCTQPINRCMDLLVRIDADALGLTLVMLMIDMPNPISMKSIQSTLLTNMTTSSKIMEVC